MTQTKENRILRHFRSLMDEQDLICFDECMSQPGTYQECKEAYQHERANNYNVVILKLAKHWKMPCKEIKLAINKAKKNPVKYDSRKLRR